MERKPRPDIVQSSSTKLATSCQNIYVTIGKVDDEPYEVFLTIGKAGGCLSCFAQALGRTISIGLQYGIPAEVYVKQLCGIQCPNPVMFPKSKRILSCPDAVGQVLKEDLTSKKE